MKIDNFFAELKRRNVYKVAVAYLVVAWLFIQAASIFLPAFDAPPWVMKIVIVFLVLAFPVALALAWAFEITPEGIKRESEVTPNESITRTTGRRIIGLTVVVAVVAAGLFAFRLWRPRLTSVSVPATTATAISEKSIAVLPFENLSDDKSNAYFAEGIQDEILTRLAKIGALKVISRTSTAHYASTPDNLPEIGRQLGVANLLEGSVQKAGDQVHINVQLIKAATDNHLWAESYDRNVQNIFAVEGEVAGAIAEALKAKLTGSEKESLAAAPTHNSAAYDAYLRGLAFQGRVDDFETSVLKSIQAFEDAVKLDPDFALAWAQMSREQGFAFINFDHSAQRREAAGHALDMAIKLGPDLPETALADGAYHYYIERDYEGAKVRFESVRRKYPNNPLPIEHLAAIARRQGQWEKSRLLYTQAMDLDPRNVFLLTDAVLTDLATRDLTSARKHLARARDLSPQNSTVISFLAESYQMSGEIERAQSVLDSIQPKEGDVIYLNISSANAILLHKYEPAITVLKSYLKKPDSFGTSLASFENLLGDLERHSGDAAAAAAAYAKAKEAAQNLLRTQPENPDAVAYLAWAETFLGNKKSALDLAHRAVTLLPASRDTLVGPTYEDSLARIEAHFGDKDNAIAGLQHLLSISYAAPAVTPALLRIDPDWDNLRGDPRFEALSSSSPPSKNGGAK